MPKLTATLSQLIQRQINGCGIVVWYDSDHACTQAVPSSLISVPPRP